MDAELKRIKKLTDFMKKSGLLHLKSGDIELNLTPAAILPMKGKPFKEEAVASPDSYSEDETLFWSSPGHLPEETKQ